MEDLFESTPSFSTFLKLVKKARLKVPCCYNKYNNISDSDYDQEIYKKCQLTYFVPTNEAFEKIPKKVLESIVNNTDVLRNLMFGNYRYFLELCYLFDFFTYPLPSRCDKKQ